MDPLTAIGLASNILSFIDFSFNLIGGSHRLLNSASGLTPENCRLGTVVEDLKVVTERLVSDLPGKTQNEKELCKLADDCHTISRELLDILSRLKLGDKKSKWNAFRAKWQSMMQEKSIASIEESLRSYQSMILIRLNFMLRYVNRPLNQCLFPAAIVRQSSSSKLIKNDFNIVSRAQK